MTAHEGFPTVAQEQTTQEAIFHQDGSLNEAFLNERYGIGTEEAMQQVFYGSFQGTVAQMLNNEKCPVGGILSTAYQEQGIEGVAEKLNAFSTIDPKFSVKITEATIQRENLKKKLIRLKYPLR